MRTVSDKQECDGMEAEQAVGDDGGAWLCSATEERLICYITLDI